MKSMVGRAIARNTLSGMLVGPGLLKNCRPVFLLMLLRPDVREEFVEQPHGFGETGPAHAMVLLDRIELSTSPLPRECSTTELQQRTLEKPRAV